ncbi:MAG: hypothetical protein OEV40_28255 [Acidimicrobiia bacterium]|nr:hypothetical protein [Acidimicrobiia bacterium]
MALDGELRSHERCSFCERTGTDGGGPAVRADATDPRICGWCLDLCDEILADETPDDR